MDNVRGIDHSTFGNPHISSWDVLKSPVYWMFHSNRMCPPWHTFSAYSKTDITGGDEKEVNQYIVVGDCTYVLLSVALQVHLLLAGLAADDISSVFT
jgi:hypothetical protein